MMDMIFSWNAVWWFMLALYVPSCLGLIIIVLLQKGKGVGFAGAFGAGGGSEAVFGPRSSKSLPQRITYSMAGLFMLLSLLMSMLSGSVGTSSAPALVDDTGMSTGATSAPAGSLSALFSDAPAEEVASVEVEKLQTVRSAN
ncbi:MAG: preprotein translocase subunit SecG [Candidatus Hydrogenedentes bacterium]|nr:preprotein translocase subunit SecG [Candidatus Hydrogenedentota bacterium]